MKIAYIAAGAAGMYCGNCLRDHALALALREIGEDVTLVPTYTPLLTDLPQGEEVHRRHLFFNGILTYLSQKLKFFRKRRPLLDRLLGSRLMVGTLSRMEVSTDASKLGALTVSMLRGESGHQARQLDELADWLEAEKPDLVHLSNALLLGMARRIRERTGVPVVCALQSEDIFVENLVDPFRDEAIELISERAREVEGLITVSEYYRGYVSDRLGIDRERVDVVLSGVPLEDHRPSPFRPRGEPLTIGYFARMAPEKGLDILCDAFIDLARRPGCENFRLKAAGYLPPASERWVRGLRNRLKSAGLGDRAELLGTVDRARKLQLLGEFDVLSVPTRHVEAKGLFLFEALAQGIPMVLPNHGTFPEVVERSGAGVLHAPSDPIALADVLESVLEDDERRRELGESGRRSAEEFFNSRRMAEETREIYQRVLSAS